MNTLLNKAQEIFNEFKNKSKKISESERSSQYFNQMGSFSAVFLQLLNEKKEKKYLLEILKKPYPRRINEKYWGIWKEIIEKKILTHSEKDLIKILGYLKWLSKIEAQKPEEDAKEPKQEKRQYKEDFRRPFKK
jgi:hypothetical protein